MLISARGGTTDCSFSQSTLFTYD
uniref:Uncharacterized protein n=1 Tax=Anguilla anguilla TaxID=7936 RepID=A0A0E9S468_ANGAN